MFKFFSFLASIFGSILCIIGLVAFSGSTIDGFSFLLFGAESFVIAFACYKFDDMESSIKNNTLTIKTDKSEFNKTANQVKDLQKAVANLKKQLEVYDKEIQRLKGYNSPSDEY